MSNCKHSEFGVIRKVGPIDKPVRSEADVRYYCAKCGEQVQGKLQATRHPLNFTLVAA